MNIKARVFNENDRAFGEVVTIVQFVDGQNGATYGVCIYDCGTIRRHEMCLLRAFSDNADPSPASQTKEA